MIESALLQRITGIVLLERIIESNTLSEASASLLAKASVEEAQSSILARSSATSLLCSFWESNIGTVATIRATKANRMFSGRRSFLNRACRSLSHYAFVVENFVEKDTYV